MNWLLSLGSLAGVLALGGVARLLRLGGSEPLAPEQVTERVQFEYNPFRVERMVIGLDGRAALVRATDGRLVAVKVHGAHPATRLLPGAPAVTTCGDLVVVDTGDRWFGPLRLRLDQAQRDMLRAML
ncbi:hypothetical protein OMW55_08215 [Sphingomonas sp. BN140010]|uniref:Uncharacterized protein n=1 Tax=Sphingomonas arvum TaxID=2992113 RepID=A0ABT3JG54_9SPHN|nr:hypothetical protein [Sphingomonas sp. BN140010]MCW3797786.1 hypothetical protein [Sphingomonas sp. BN140010]